MTEGFRLVRIDFDNLENKADAALISTELGVFLDDAGATAYAKVQDFLHDEVEPHTHYLGHNKEVYPQYKLFPFRAR